MNRQLEIFAAAMALVSTLVGATVVIEGRYAKAQEVRSQLSDYYAKTLKLRILEIQLKANPTPADRALLQYLQQELKDLSPR